MRECRASTEHLANPLKLETQQMTLGIGQLTLAEQLRTVSHSALHERQHTIRPKRLSGRNTGRSNAVVGIDLGTSNSAIGVIHGGEAKILETGDGKTTSSWVAFTEVKSV